MLDQAMKDQVSTYLDKLLSPVELLASLDESPASRETQALLEDLVSLSNKLSWRKVEGAERTPSFTVGAKGEARVSFAGVPMGHEFSSLILALLQAGGHPPKLDERLVRAIKNLSVHNTFETFISLSCHNCPEVVQALNAMAILNPRIKHTMIDGMHFEAEVKSRNVMAVPAVFLNGVLFGQGRMGVEEILQKLEASTGGASERERAALLDSKAPYDLLIVGGGPAGAAAAIYAARKGLRTGIVTERFGGQVGDTLGIENFVSVGYTEGPKLVTSLEEHVRSYGVDVMTLERAEKLRPGSVDGLHTLTLKSGAHLRARTLILATGARWREMNVPGESEYRTRGVAFCPHCDGPLFKGKRVAVIGGGNSGVEAAIDLAGIVSHVTLLEFGESLRADAVLQEKLRSLPNVDVRLNAQTTEVLGDGQRVTGLNYRDRRTNAVERVEVAGIFVQIGLLPNTDWLRGTLALTQHGEIETDARGQTSVHGVFAAGDVTTVPFKQIVIAIGEGAKASLGAFEHLMRSALPRAS